MATLLRMQTALLDILVPMCCAGCGKHGAQLCVSCSSHIEAAPPVHRAARAGNPPVIALGWHAGILRRAIIGLKFQQRRSVARELGAMLAGRLGCSCDAVVPVPLHQQRLRERGFNQAALIARAMATRMGVSLYEDALIRALPTAPQTSLPLRQRVNNVSGAFRSSASAGAALRGKRVMLVDDVITTGSTIAACAAALKDVGVSGVLAVALALAPLRHQDARSSRIRHR